jgi:hypothetical protein
MPIQTLRALSGLALALALAARLAAAAPENPAPKPTAAPLEDPSSVSGTVVETLDASGYTYLRLETKDGEVWAAVKKTSVTAGTAVTIVGVSRMDGFESKSLGRTFDRIWFGSLASGADAPAGPVSTAAALPPGHVPVGGAADSKAMAAQHAGASTAPVEGVIQVEKAGGPDGRTVAEVYADRAALKGRSVAVRGKVVKFNADIMGKNWIHLRDGTGSATAKDNDLTVTTDGVAHVGDVVTVSGAVSVDRDFGSGYAYAVILEGATVSK